MWCPGSHRCWGMQVSVYVPIKTLAFWVVRGARQTHSLGSPNLGMLKDDCDLVFPGETSPRRLVPRLVNKLKSSPEVTWCGEWHHCLPHPTHTCTETPEEFKNLCSKEAQFCQQQPPVFPYSLSCTYPVLHPMLKLLWINSIVSKKIKGKTELYQQKYRHMDNCMLLVLRIFYSYKIIKLWSMAKLNSALVSRIIPERYYPNQLGATSQKRLRTTDLGSPYLILFSISALADSSF